MTALAVFAPGMLLVIGVFWIVLAFRPEHVQLGDALASLGDVRPAHETDADAPPSERLGTWWLRRRGAAVSPATERALELTGRTVAAHYSHKLVGAIVGFTGPLAIGLVMTLVRVDATLPLLLSLGGAVLGFFWPDLALRGAGATLAADANESLLTYFDLVTLERMANQSATQSLHAAAALSDTTIFTQVRGALERARLEQRMPFGELKALGQRLELPALVDLADVMRLDESGAALSNTLRARVKELRDAHLTDMKMAATAVSERMTVFMVLPSMVFGLIFLAPPILKLLSG